MGKDPDRDGVGPDGRMRWQAARPAVAIYGVSVAGELAVVAMGVMAAFAGGREGLRLAYYIVLGGTAAAASGVLVTALRLLRLPPATGTRWWTLLGLVCSVGCVVLVAYSLYVRAQLMLGHHSDRAEVLERLEWFARVVFVLVTVGTVAFLRVFGRVADGVGAGTRVTGGVYRVLSVVFGLAGVVFCLVWIVPSFAFLSLGGLSAGSAIGPLPAGVVGLFAPVFLLSALRSLHRAMGDERGRRPG